MFVRRIVVVLAVVVMCCCVTQEASARGRFFRRGGGGGGGGHMGVPAGYSTETAQDVANLQAATGNMGHYGGNYGYEGCAVAGSPQAALANCCYANSGMYVGDQGVAQGRNGMWYACKRYGVPPAAYMARLAARRAPPSAPSTENAVAAAEAAEDAESQ